MGCVASYISFPVGMGISSALFLCKMTGEMACGKITFQIRQVQREGSVEKKRLSFSFSRGHG